MVARLHLEAARRLAALVPLPHVQVRPLDIPAEALAVEERRAAAVAQKLVAHRGKRTRVARQRERERLVIGEARRHQLAQVERAEQARRDAAGEGAAEAG